jgi:hypothetical protein
VTPSGIETALESAEQPKRCADLRMDVLGLRETPMGSHEGGWNLRRATEIGSSGPQVGPRSLIALD